IPGRVPTLPGERRWKPQGSWASRASAQLHLRETSLPGYQATLIQRPGPTWPGDWHYRRRMIFVRVTSCLSIMKTDRVGGKHPMIDLLIGTCWLAPFSSSRAHVNSPALELIPAPVRGLRKKVLY